MTLFDTSLYKLDTSLIPEAVALYEKLNIKKTPLSLIPPQVWKGLLWRAQHPSVQ